MCVIVGEQCTIRLLRNKIVIFHIQLMIYTYWCCFLHTHTIYTHIIDATRVQLSVETVQPVHNCRLVSKLCNLLITAGLCPQSAVDGSAEPAPSGGRLENVQLGLSGQHDATGQ